MDRQIVYVGAIPLDTDQMLQSRNTMVAIGSLVKMVVGDGTAYADGLSCMPGAGLSLLIGPGSLTSPGVIDAGFVGSLPPDGDPLVKIGINTGSTLLNIAGPGSYLVCGSVAEVPAGDAVVAYYNASNPAQTLYGPAGNGAFEATILQQRVVLTVSAGTAVSSGYVPLWTITVPMGAAAIDATMISMAPDAPFITVKLPGAAPSASPIFTGSPVAPTAIVGDTSTLLATTGFVAAAGRRARAVWAIPGSQQWVCPAGVSQVLFRGWAPGGAGGAGIGGSAGGGGGGGGYSELLIDVVAGQTYLIAVGAGGGVSGPGSVTSFAGLLSVAAGGNGGDGAVGQAGAGGAAGGSSFVAPGFLSSPGVSAGQPGFVLAGIILGGTGGSSFGNAQPFPTPTGGAGIAGVWPGGGGSGGSNGAGGHGAGGLVVLEWGGKPNA